MKPMEWKIGSDGRASPLVWDERYRDRPNSVHVIEYSAFVAAITEASEQNKLVYIRTKERDEMAERLRSEELLAFREAREATKERDVLRVEYTKIYELVKINDFHYVNLISAERDRSAQFEKERDEAIRAMNDAHDSLRKSGEQDAALRRGRDEAREALAFYKSEKDEDPGRWQYWRASRAKLLDNLNAERARSAKLVEALQSINQCDVMEGCSVCAGMAYKALAEYSKGES